MEAVNIVQPLVRLLYEEITPPMRLFAQFTLLALLATGMSFGQTGAKEDMKDAGHAAKESGKSAGRAAKKAGKGAYKGAKKGVSKAAEKTAEGAEKVADKTK